MEHADARCLFAPLLAHTRELIPLRAAAIRVDRNSLVDAARASLRNLQENRPGLEALAYLDPALDLLEDVLDRAESHRDAGLAKQVPGRLPRATLAQPLHDAVVRRLDRADDDQYRCLAGLLRHLGLVVTLQALVDRALQSADRHIREVGEDFRQCLAEGATRIDSPQRGVIDTMMARTVGGIAPVACVLPTSPSQT